MGLWDLDTCGNLSICAKCKSVYGFQWDLNPVSPKGFIVQGIYTIANQIILVLSNKTA